MTTTTTATATTKSVCISLALLFLMTMTCHCHLMKTSNSNNNFIISIEAIAQEANWIMGCVMEPSGAIATYTLQSEPYNVSPYMANYASMGLSRASAYTQNSTYVKSSWKWLQWYQKHQDSNGYVTDYSGTPNNLTSTGNMDSTDAYAGTFLLACLEAYKTSQDLFALQSLHQGIRMAVIAIESTQDIDGLTWAKPSYHVKYLMDIAETYAGLLAAQSMALLLNDSELYARAQNDSQRMYQGAQNLWNPEIQAFNWAVFSDGVQQVNNWTVFYPDSASQMWAAAFALSTDSQANDIISIFLNDHSQWVDPMAQDMFNTNGQYQLQSVGYFPLIAFALLRYNRSELAFQSVSSIEQGAVNASKAWSFTPYSQAMILMVETDDLIGSYELPGAHSSKPFTSSTIVEHTTSDASPAIHVLWKKQHLVYYLCFSVFIILSITIL